MPGNKSYADRVADNFMNAGKGGGFGERSPPDMMVGDMERQAQGFVQIMHDRRQEMKMMHPPLSSDEQRKRNEQAFRRAFNAMNQF